MTFEEAATLPVGGFNAVYLLRKANIQRGEKVLINGAGGSMGTYAVQIAKHFGAEVTGVDSTAKLDMLRSIGADHVIDYIQKDFTQSGETYDVIFDVIGKSSFFQYDESTKPPWTLSDSRSSDVADIPMAMDRVEERQEGHLLDAKDCRPVH